MKPSCLSIMNILYSLHIHIKDTSHYPLYCHALISWIVENLTLILSLWLTVTKNDDSRFDENKKSYTAIKLKDFLNPFSNKVHLPLNTAIKIISIYIPSTCMVKSYLFPLVIHITVVRALLNVFLVLFYYCLHFYLLFCCPTPNTASLTQCWSLGFIYS